MNKEQFIGYNEYIKPHHEWVIGADPGHGGFVDGEYQTKGKKQDHGDFTFYEGYFNRAVLLYLADMLLKEDVGHYFTTDTNYDVALGIRSRRVNNMVRKHSKKKHLLISIHANWFKDSKVQGIETITYTSSKASKPYGVAVDNRLEEMGWPMRPMKRKNLHILRETTCPSLLVELGFFSNREEAVELMKPEVQKEFAGLIFKAIKDIIHED